MNKILNISKSFPNYLFNNSKFKENKNESTSNSINLSSIYSKNGNFKSINSVKNINRNNSENNKTNNKNKVHINKKSGKKIVKKLDFLL